MPTSLGQGMSMIWLGQVAALNPAPPPTDDAIELESGEGLIALEDGSGYILLET